MKIRNKILFYAVLALVGVGLVLTGSFVIDRESLKAVSGILIGVGAGLFGMSIAQVVMLSMRARNPAYRRKSDIESNDERNVQIANMAKGKAFDAMGWILGMLMLVYVLMDADMPTILLLVGAYLLVFAIYIAYLGKYVKKM